MKRLSLVVAFCCCAVLAGAQEVVVAAAADLSSVFPEVAGRFEKETGRKVKTNFGSSGQIMLQIENGAPIDVFFSGYSLRKLAEIAGCTEGTIRNYEILGVCRGRQNRCWATARSRCAGWFRWRVKSRSAFRTIATMSGPTASARPLCECHTSNHFQRKT